MKSSALDISKLPLASRTFTAVSMSYVMYAHVDACGETRVLAHEQLSPTVGVPVPGTRIYVEERLYDVISLVRCPNMGMIVAEVTLLDSAHDHVAAAVRERHRAAATLS